MSELPDVDEWRKMFRPVQRKSRFHESMCAKCGKLVTNQAMGRKAHMDAHKRAEAKEKA